MKTTLRNVNGGKDGALKNWNRERVLAKLVKTRAPGLNREIAINAGLFFLFGILLVVLGVYTIPLVWLADITTTIMFGVVLGVYLANIMVFILIAQSFVYLLQDTDLYQTLAFEAAMYRSDEEVEI